MRVRRHQARVRMSDSSHREIRRTKLHTCRAKELAGIHQLVMRCEVVFLQDAACFPLQDSAMVVSKDSPMRKLIPISLVLVSAGVAVVLALALRAEPTAPATPTA